MAAGKTTVGRMLADRLGWTFADLDDDIEKSEGQTIADIFDQRGEAEFRRIEYDAVRSRVRTVERGCPTVVALGGGAFAQPKNRTLLSENGITIWLDCDFDRVCARLAGTSHRPLARDGEKFARLYQERQSDYSEAEYRVAIASDDPATTVDAILALPFF
jgi:shikimate kinase